MRCPNCQTENQPGSEFCDQCGTSLTGAPASAASATAPTPAARPTPPAPAPTPPIAPTPAPVASAGTVKCPVCSHDNFAANVYCDNCGAPMNAPQPSVSITPPAPPLPTPVTSNIPPAPPSSSVGMIAATPANLPPPANHPRFIIAANGMCFDIANRANVLIGRVDPITPIFPEIDLTAHNGDDLGVSRQHCRITLEGLQYFAEDLGSTNGTFIGVNRLQKNVRAPLNNGDQLRLGKLVLNFFTGQ